MKKNVLFLIPMIVVAALLFLLSVTGIKAHIAISVVGLLLLVGYTIATKKEWKCVVCEILMRLGYAVALISGIVLMNGIKAAFIAHQAGAIVFAVLLIVIEIPKLIKKQ